MRTETMARKPEPSISTQVVGNLFFRGDETRLSVSHDARSPAVLTVTAHDGSTVVERKLARRKHQNLNLGKLPLDFYAAKLSVDRTEIARTSFGVIPRRRIKGDPEAHSLGIWAKCGLPYMRVDCPVDQVLTGKPGVTNWKDNSKFADGRGGWSCGGEINNFPDLFRTIKKVGMEPFPIMETKSGNWEIGQMGTVRLIPIHEHLEEYRKCVYEAVKMCGLCAVECWNEPEFYWNLGEAAPEGHGRFNRYMSMEDYVRTLRACYESAKRADPNCQVVVGASLHQGQFSENAYQFGGAPYFDILGSHYLSANSPYDFGYQVHYLREIMRRYGESKPIWDTEWGCGGAQPWDAVLGGETFQAAFETKFITQAAMHDVVPAGHFDRITGEHGPLPRTVALAVITSVLEGTEFLGALDLGRDNAGIIFQKRNRATCGVFWAKHRARLVLKTTAESVVSRGILGAPRRVRTEEGLLKLDLNEIPVILEGLGEVEIAEGPYDSEDYGAVRDFSGIGRSEASRELPRPFPQVRPGQISIDGDLGDWSGIPAICVPNKAQLTECVPEHYKFDRYQTLRGEARVAHDDEHFYIASVVRKDRKAQVNVDVANVMFAMRGFDWGVQWSDFSKGQSLLTLMSRPGGPNVVQTNGYDMSIAERELTEARIATRIGKDEITFEAAIPWDAFRPITPTPGKTVELLLLFGGDDGNDYYWWYRMLGTHWYCRPPAETVELRFWKVRDKRRPRLSG